MTSTTLDRYSAEYLDRIAGSLYSSVLSDILDEAGHRHQVMRPEVRPLYPGAKMAGRAATMLAVAVSELPEQPYKLLMDLLDGLRPGEVVVAGVQGDVRAALWGELLSTHTRARGGRGAVLDGLSRDSWGIEDMKFPVFATGVTPGDSKGRLEVLAIRQPMLAGGVAVTDGDLVLADEDGVVVVPAALEDEVVGRALGKVAGENTIRDLLRQGASIRKVFEEHGIL
ncbi:MAG TPA: RraA family protein [Candidatus Dormibacteraeota bacterium]|nr:RraA family protein [Candidatus Dormibacteraeota bacterium]